MHNQKKLKITNKKKFKNSLHVTLKKKKNNILLSKCIWEIKKCLSEKKLSKNNFLILSGFTFVFIFIFIFAITGPLKSLFLKHNTLSEEYVLVWYSSTSQIDKLNSQIIVNTPPILKDKNNPINGNSISEEKFNELANKKVYGVIINNHPDARPQYGLSLADMVMEVLAEGGITRYVALFYENEPEKIGPVRSLRRYMCDFLAEFDSPVMLHEGWATFNSSNKVYVREVDAQADVNQFGYKSMQSPGSRYRDLEKAAKSGYVHSLYTSYALIDSEFDRSAPILGWETESNIEELAWKYDDLYKDRGNGGKISINFLSFADAISASGFEYNKLSNSYDRTILGTNDIDLVNNQRISPKNVVIEWHDFRIANDGYARVIIDMIGGNQVQIYRDGKVFSGTWKKTSRMARTRYYDNEGKEIPLNRGQIWKVVAVKQGNAELSNVSYQEN